jgi:iron(III) transport system permease protein
VGNSVVTIFVLGYAVLAVLLPCAQLVLGSLQPLFGVNQGYSLNNYRDLLADPTVVPALTHTAVRGVVAVSISLALGIAGRHASVRLRRLFELSTWMPWALNGVVLALGLIWAFLAIPGLRSRFGSVDMLLVALIIATTPLAARTVDGALAQIAPDLEESARVHGASPLRSAVDIVLRLVLPSFLAGWLVVGIHIAGDLEVPILLSTPDSRTLSVVVYTLYGSGQAAKAAALFCMLIGAAVAVMGVGGAVVGMSRLLRLRRTSIPGADDPDGLQIPGPANPTAAGDLDHARTAVPRLTVYSGDR